jgi:hypothetical protein
VCPRSGVTDLDADARQELPRGKFLKEEVLAPLLVFVPDEAHKLARSVKRERARPSRKFQASFLGSAVALAVVAGVAAGHEVFPRRASTSRARHHVIERQLAGRKCPRAELARVVIAQKNIFTRKRARLLRDVPVGKQANDRWNFQSSRSGMNFGSIQLFGLRDTLDHQNERATDSGDIDGLEGCVEN